MKLSGGVEVLKDTLVTSGDNVGITKGVRKGEEISDSRQGRSEDVRLEVESQTRSPLGGIRAVVSLIPQGSDCNRSVRKCEGTTLVKRNTTMSSRDLVYQSSKIQTTLFLDRDRPR